MSGDTPTEHSLDCPGCGSEVFIRDTAAWYTDEEEHCAGCGSRVMVALDEDDADPDLLTARVYIYEHGGEVVARLLAEVAALTQERDALWEDGVETTTALHAACERAGTAERERDARPTTKAAGARVDRIAAEWRTEVDRVKAAAARLREQLAEALDRALTTAGPAPRDIERRLVGDLAAILRGSRTKSPVARAALDEEPGA